MGTLSTRPTLLPCLSTTIVICLALVVEDIARAQDRQKEVLALYSTRRDAQIAVVGDREMSRILERSLPGGVDYYSEHLDQARFTNPSYQQAFHDFLQLKYAGHRFDVVIAMSPISLTFIEKNRSSLFPKTPVVFFSSDSDTRPIMNSTGVKAALNLSDTIALALELQPDTRHVFVISGTGTDAFYASAAQTQLRPFEKRLTFTYLSGLITSELESRLRTLPEHSIVYYLVVNRDGAGEDVHPLNYLDRVAAIANAPTYSWVDSAMGHGIIGGSVKSQDAEVSAVAGLALRVLHGERADSISPAEMDLNVRQVDWRQLRRWNIRESRVPAGTRIVFREPGLWDRYKLYLLGGIVLVLAESALIAGLLTQARRRRRVEEHMRDKLAELRTSDERIRDLNRRLVSAQDTERSSLARELHDNIGPQMALLTVDLELLRRARQSEAAAPIAREAIERIQHIADRFLAVLAALDQVHGLLNPRGSQCWREGLDLRLAQCDPD